LMKPGSKLWLYVPKELVGISPGYYMALSNQAINPDEAKGIVRLYWNLRAEGAEPFVRDATRLLNEAGLFFKLKVLSDPRSYMRCDAAVVYVCQDDYLPVAEILSGIYPQVARYLKPSVPMFTKLLAPGVGLAEDPGQAESFGQHRCRLLAESMIRAFEEGARTLDDRLRIATDCYASAGIRLSHPYLNPKSSDVYTFQRLG
jgi:HopA1 effector protein family